MNPGTSLLSISTDAPTQRSSEFSPLLVAVEDSSGTFTREPRLQVTKLVLACDAELSHAECKIILAPIFETQYHAADPEVTIADVLSGQPRIGGQGLISPDQKVAIYRHNDQGGRDIVFCGYGEWPQYSERNATGSGGATGCEMSGSILIESVLKRVSKSARGQIYGRYVRTASSADAWLAAYQAEPDDKTRAIGIEDDVVTVHRPCTFNARGEANRHPAPITVLIDGVEEWVYVFTDDDDPNAVAWTWAQALRYLTYFHLLELDETGVPTGQINYTNVFAQTRDYITSTTADRPTRPVYEPEGYDGNPETVSQLLKFGLLDVPRDAVFDMVTIHEALATLAQATGAHVRIQTYNAAGSDTPLNAFLVSARGGGPRRTVAKDWSAEDAGALSVPEILEKLNIEQMQVSANYGDVVSKLIPMGDIRRYEITASLVPGWLPNSELDRPANVETAVSAGTGHAVDDAWYAKYHASGTGFATYARDGRRWVLNETGRYLAASYARASGHYVAAKYAPWEPSDCDITVTRLASDLSIETVAVPAGAWARIPRPFQECFSADSARRSLGVVIEASFDGGTKWERISAKVLNSEAGIWIETDDLSKMMSVHNEAVSWWEALCRDNARVRVTAVIDGDLRIYLPLASTDAATGGLPIQHEAARLIDWSDRIKSNRRDGGNSQFAAAGDYPAPSQTAEARDDLAVMRDWALTLFDVVTARQIPAAFTVPWLEFKKYWVGDCLTQLVGQSLVLEGAPSGGLRRPPDIVSIVYSGTSTQLVLEDSRMADLAGLGIG